LELTLKPARLHVWSVLQASVAPEAVIKLLALQTTTVLQVLPHAPPSSLARTPSQWILRQELANPAIIRTLQPPSCAPNALLAQSVASSQFLPVPAPITAPLVHRTLLAPALPTSTAPQERVLAQMASTYLVQRVLHALKDKSVP